MNSEVRKRNRRRQRYGMTLLEVIVAMTVLAIGITGVLAAISACLRNSDASASYSHGALLAQQVAAELDRKETLEPDSLSGTFDDMATSYSWQAEVSVPTTEGCYPVHISVLWDRGRRHYDLETVLYPHALPTATPATPATPDAGGDEETTPPGGVQPGGGQTGPGGAQPGGTQTRAAHGRREAR